MRRFLPFLAVLLVCLFGGMGCHRQAEYESKLQSWVGADVNRMIGSWGPPTSTYDLPNGNKIYSWSRSAHGATAVPTFGGGVMVQNFSRSCDVNMTVNGSDEIISWQYQGNACF